MSTPDRLSAIGQPLLESEAFETNKQSGSSTTRVFTGSKQNMIAQRMTELAFGASLIKLESTGDGNYRLTAGYSWDASSGAGPSDPPVNTHELENGLVAVDAFTSDVLRNQVFNAFGGTYAGMMSGLVRLRGLLTRWDRSDQNAAAQNDIEGSLSDLSGVQLALMLNLFRGIAIHNLGTTSQFNSVYRRRITAASYNQIQAGFEGVGKIWTTNELVAFENVPSAWWFQLPTDRVWQKSAPTVNTVAGQKTEIIYSYVAAKAAWSGTQEAYGSAPLLTF
jgi:hypothetical protein